MHKVHNKTTIVGLLLFLCLHPTMLWGEYLVGVGKADITGPAVGSGMMCYAESSQISMGINDRQWARAFIISETVSRNSLVIVVIDAGAVFASVYQAVLARLGRHYQGHYSDHNLVITATHTHSASGGQSHHFLYNMPFGVFDHQAFEKMVSGILQAIARAHTSLASGKVFYQQGELSNASDNRSLPAYFNNLDRADYSTFIDEKMQLLKLERNGQPVGAIAWFATHGVSFPKSNRLLSSDNKGYAAWLFERYARDHWQQPDFVAAFPQASAGDMTPNLNLDGTGPGGSPEENVRIIGTRQFAKALELFQSGGIEVNGPLGSLQRQIDFSRLEVAPAFTQQGGAVTTCPAAMGYSFAAGTEDGRPNWLFRQLFSLTEGRLHGNRLLEWGTEFISEPGTGAPVCQ